jgi:outer membrane receptor protein involved in Fe transport
MNRTRSALLFGFLATTSLASPALGQNVPPDTATQPQTTGQSPAPATNATDVTAPPKRVQNAQEAAGVPDQTEIIITATKREENLQNVPISVSVLGTRKLDQLNISNFEEYTKQLPSVTFSTAQPGFTTVYMRGIATGGDDSNHSGSLPTVGTYLDEQPITTIDGTLDVHIYDIARIEALSGPQGTLFGASSEAGTVRIITNKPQLGVTAGRIDGELNTVDHGGVGGKLEGMINLPIARNIAFRAVGFYERDAGYIDNVFGQVTLCGTTTEDGCIHNGIHYDNAPYVKKNFNDLKTYGGRAALKIDLDDNWTVLPQFMYQKTVANGVFFMDADQGDLQTVRYQPEIAKDRFWQAALTIEGKIAHFFDVTYAGAYMDRPRYTTSDYSDYTVAYDNTYEYCGGLAGCSFFDFRDNQGNPINPRQHIIGTDHFKKMSQELRVATPADRPVRALVGAFYQDQKNHIFQDYLIDNLATSLSVPGYPGTLWLTNQLREDKDWALFGEANWDITHTITLTGGLRFYRFDNTLYGFAGFGPEPNAAGSHTGVDRCLPVVDDPNSDLNGLHDPNVPYATGTSGLDIPCYNVADVGPDGQAVPRRSEGTGHIHRLNIQWKPQQNLMFYATWSKGFRPGGINRQPETPPYAPDFLTNYEAGWKTTILGTRLRWDGAIYHERWSGFQFGYLGPNSLTVVQNGRNANVNGIETQIDYVARGLSLTAAAAYTDAKTVGNICKASIPIDPSPDCSGKQSNGKDDFIVAPSGSRLAITPKLKLSGTARYTWPMWTGNAHVQGAISYQSSGRSELREADADFIGDIPSSTLVDLFLGYDWSRYSAELFATNVFDERNQLSRFVVCGACTNIHIVPGRPRTIGLRVGAHF